MKTNKMVEWEIFIYFVLILSSFIFGFGLVEAIYTHIKRKKRVVVAVADYVPDSFYIFFDETYKLKVIIFLPPFRYQTYTVWVRFTPFDIEKKKIGYVCGEKKT